MRVTASSLGQALSYLRASSSADASSKSLFASAPAGGRFWARAGCAAARSASAAIERWSRQNVFTIAPGADRTRSLERVRRLLEADLAFPGHLVPHSSDTAGRRHLLGGRDCHIGRRWIERR